MDLERLKKYAELTVKVGVNIQKGQILLINSPVECPEFYSCYAKTSQPIISKNLFDILVDLLFAFFNFEYN